MSYRSGVDFTKSRKSKINRKCYRKCDFQAFDWLKFTLTTDLRLTTFCEIDHRFTFRSGPMIFGRVMALGL